MKPKWIALTNTTLGVLMAGINTSILLIALPPIFRGLGIDPLAPDNTSLLLWVLLSYSVVTTTLLVTVGRVSDIYGRVRLYTSGFAVFTGASALLTATWSTGTAGALEIIGFRVIQGLGAASLFANSAAIITDVFPAHRRGFALGGNQVALVAGSMIGLVLGGVLAVIDWRIVFAVSIPFGVAGTLWAWFRLQETARPRGRQRVDPLGNAAFGVGLTALLAALTYGILPYGNSLTGWSNPWVVGGLALGALLLALFVYIETRVPQPMFRLDLFTIRPFAAGNLAGWLAGIAHGGVQFLLIIASGRVAASARLSVFHYAAMGRNLHAANDGRKSGRSPGICRTATAPACSPRWAWRWRRSGSACWRSSTPISFIGISP
jgi:MFS family permease